MNKQQAWLDYLRNRPKTSTEEDDFEAGWNAAIKTAAERVGDFTEENSAYEAGRALLQEYGE